MHQKLWEADSKTKTKSNLFEFEKFLATKFNYTSYKNYKKLFNWSIKNPKLFWSSTLTLKQGVQNLLCHYIPEVKEVLAV